MLDASVCRSQFVEITISCCCPVKIPPPPLIRIVDFAGNHGGGLRFAVETMRAMLASSASGVRFELVSYGAALARYRQVLEREELDVSTREVLPSSHRHKLWVRVRGLPKISGVLARLGLGSNIVHALPPEVEDGCDLLWLPWIHFHQANLRGHCPTVASLHDLIIFQYSGLMPRALLRVERRNLKRWLASPSRIVISSGATRTAMGSLFGVSDDRCDIVRVSGEHQNSTITARINPEWAFINRPFLLCPANYSRHKNHECIFRALALWGRRMPIVLTGMGTDLKESSRRTSEFRREIAACGLEFGRDIFGLGYIDDSLYYGLLERAWALVMPSFYEGGGSFPTMEALLRGVPVVCSDIPVLREQMDEMNAEALWFDPAVPQDLVASLVRLQQDNDRWRRLAVEQIAGFRRRTWQDVAGDYKKIFAASSPSLASILT
jgi:glycosyltransferase involved in cell wall biosynthesis